MAKSKSSKRWLSEHFSDPYVKLAQERGYRSRAVFKLEEIDARDRLLKQGMTIVDLGAAPGGWSEFAAKRIGRSGTIIAVDLLPMEELPHGHVIQGDMSDPGVRQQIVAMLDGRRVDLVMSDMAPNLSGMPSVDQARAINLAEAATDLAAELLRPGGSMLIKVFQGSGFESYQRHLKSLFKSVAHRKPRCSRDRSSEVYLMAQDFCV